jgi:hypothetical protein
MPLDTKLLLDLTEDDLLELIANGIEERREIEYKQILKIGTDGDKKEFLFDVSSFGNASGGHLIFGIAETDGRPTAVTPLAIANRDLERLTLGRERRTARRAPQWITRGHFCRKACRPTRLARLINTGAALFHDQRRLSATFHPLPAGKPEIQAKDQAAE